jgi:hypothetical protein
VIFRDTLMSRVWCAQKASPAAGPDSPPLSGLSHSLHPTAAGMATHDTDPQTSHQPTPRDAAIYALAQARRYRHHPGCRCMTFEGLYCSAADALWSRALDRELDSV